MADDDQTAPGGRRQSYSVPALEKAFDVFEHLADHPFGLTISEMAAGLNRTINELFRLIVVMERRGYLRRDPGSDRYRVTYRLIEIGFRATPAQNLVAVATPALERLAITSGQSCHLVVLHDRSCVVIARHEAPGPTSFSVRLGTDVDPLDSCSGNILLAFATDTQRSAFLGRIRTAAARNTLSQQLDEIRARGHERRASPMTNGVIDLSRPIFGLSGAVVAALTIPYLERIERSQSLPIDQVAALHEAAAAQISASLGGDRMPAA